MAATSARVNAAKMTKTKMCKFALVGFCSRGAHCAYAHSADDLKPLPDLRCTKLCQALLETGTCSDPRCTFAHSPGELRKSPSAVAASKTKMCQFYSRTGRCKLGSGCNFSHDAAELRSSAGAGRLLPEGGEEPERLRRAPQAPNLQAHALRVSDEALCVFPPGFEHEAGMPGKDRRPGAGPRRLDGPAYVALPRMSGPWSCGGAAGGLPLEWQALQLMLQAHDEVLGAQGLGRARDDVVVDQRDGVLNIDAGLAEGASRAPGGPKARSGPLRSVRTSESTLCSLSDHLL